MKRTIGGDVAGFPRRRLSPQQAGAEAGLAPAQSPDRDPPSPRPTGVRLSSGGRTSPAGPQTAPPIHR